MTVEIHLTTADADATFFDLYSNIDGYTTPFETNVPVASLLASYQTSLVPDDTYIIRVQNVGASCSNYIDIGLTTTTTTTSSTTTTTTTVLSVECNATTNSGGVGVTEYTIPLEDTGGTIIMDFNAQGVPDKLEIIHNGVRVATSSMTGANSGPFDTLYGDPTVPTSAQASETTEFIGSSKGTIPGRDSEFVADTGITTITRTRQQLVWWVYDANDYTTNSNVIVRVTGPSGTAWNLDRRCEPEPLTMFSASTTTGDHCTTPDLSPYDQSLYHDGVGTYPAVGDTIYTDSGGTTPFVSGTAVQMADTNYLTTDGNGVSTTLSACP